LTDGRTDGRTTHRAIDALQHNRSASTRTFLLSFVLQEENNTGVTIDNVHFGLLRVPDLVQATLLSDAK